MRIANIVIIIATVLACSVYTGCWDRAFDARGETEILWDTYGVPHIFACGTKGLFHAYGWAQMQNHGDLLLELYGRSRGRGAEYGGPEELERDVILHTIGIPQHARAWLKAYSPQVRKYLDAFAQGINDWAEEHEDEIAEERASVLPVTAEDILCHTMYMLTVAWPGGRRSAIPALIDSWKHTGSADFPRMTTAAGGGWALAPSRTKSGNAILLANPHFPWTEPFTLFEAQLAAPGIDAYGATLVGFPLPIFVFNNHVGWTLTANLFDGVEAYELERSGNGYLFDGQVKPFEREQATLRIRNAGDEFSEKSVNILRSVHGPILAVTPGKALAFRYPGLDRPLIWEQVHDMLRSRNLKDFEKAMGRGQLTNLSVLYADRDGHILIAENGIHAVRPHGDYAIWNDILPGTASSTLWREYHPYSDCPKVADPPSGWLQSADGPVDLCTVPTVFDPRPYPGHMLSSAFFDENASAMPLVMLRLQRSTRILEGSGKVSFDDVIRMKHSARMELADRVLPELFSAVERYGDAQTQSAADVLRQWDRCADAESRGALLFAIWVAEMNWDPFSRRWTRRHPLETPAGLRNPRQAVLALKNAADTALQRYGRIDASYGEYYRFRGEGLDFPANGADGEFGVFRTVTYDAPGKDRIRRASGGDSYVAVIEFSNPLKAMVLLANGNATQVGSKHRSDQLRLLSKKQLREVWKTREDIEKHLETRETLDF